MLSLRVELEVELEVVLGGLVVGLGVVILSLGVERRQCLWSRVTSVVGSVVLAADVLYCSLGWVWVWGCKGERCVEYTLRLGSG